MRTSTCTVRPKSSHGLLHNEGVRSIRTHAKEFHPRTNYQERLCDGEHSDHR